MADNVLINPGQATPISTDDIGGGVQVQRVKVQYGVDGTGTDVNATTPLPVTLANTGANATAVKVDGSAATQPVSGTVTAAQATAASLNATVVGTGTFAVQAAQSGTWNVTSISGTVTLPTGASTAAKQPALGTAGTAATDVITIQGIASMTKLLVTPDANSAVNVAQINGATPLMGAGNTGTGSPRITISTDQAALPTFGHGATAASVPANITYSGRRGTTALPTAVTDGQAVGAMADKLGRTVSLIGTIRTLRVTQTTTISASTSETTIATAVASTFLDIILLVISNTSSATNTRIDFRDTTAGSVLFSLQSNGGQPPIGFSIPSGIPQTTVNTNWTAQCATSTTDIRAYIVCEKNI